MMKNTELTKLKKENRLLTKRLRSTHGKLSSAVPQVCYCVLLTVYFLICSHAISGSFNPAGAIR